MKPTILFDASRLISRTERAVPTGVDRVCMAYAQWLLGRSDIRVMPVRSRHDQLVAVDEAWFRGAIDRLQARWTRGRSVDLPANPSVRQILAALGSDKPVASVMDAPPETPPERTVARRLRVFSQFARSHRLNTPPSAKFYFNVGHTSLNTPGILTSLRAQGIETVVLLHDLIPITHPEFCRAGDDEKHRTRVMIALRHASRIVVNSRYTADELNRFAQHERLQPPPIYPAHLGLDDVFAARPRIQPPRPYFVHIGTIEARKNLTFLLSVWRRLEERMGAATPRLVLVGRYGWENEAVLDHLERSPRLRGLVHQASNVPDAALADLMANAQAVVAPSSVEGFDLPAVEAAAMGVPLIASDIPAHRELVPQAELIDPLDGLGWLSALERAARQRPKAPSYTPPSWADHFRIVADQIGMSAPASVKA